MNKLIMMLFFVNAVTATEDIYQLESKRKVERELLETMIQNEVDSFATLQKAAQDWFVNGGHQSRVLQYNTPYEIPLDEVKSDGFLSQSAFLRQPGGTSGVDEESTLWVPYTVKVQKIAEASGDIFKIIVTLGEKSAVLPPPLIPNCYVFASYRLDGVVTGWNWYELPSRAGAVLPFANQSCADVGLGTLNTFASNVVNNWASYITPGIQPNNPSSCSIVASLPGFVTPPANTYSDVAHCTFNYTSPATPTYCQGFLFLTYDAGPTTSYFLSTLGHDCINADRPVFATQATNKITDLGVDASSPVCGIVNSHEIRCLSTENEPSGPPIDPPPPGYTECEVFVYDQEGILPPVRTYYYDDRDCTGMHTNGTQTILEWLQFTEHYYNEFVLDGSGNVDNTRVDSNEFCEFHYDSSGTLGNEFTADVYYNCDNEQKLLDFEISYNLSNPNNQIANCINYTGALAPGDIQHKAKCEVVENTIDVIIEPGPFDSEWYYTPYDPVGDPAAGGRYNTELYVLPLTGNGGINNGMVETHIIQVGDNHGDTHDQYYSPWITIEAGYTINNLLTLGYTYNMSYVLTQKTATNPSDLTCLASGSGNLVSGTMSFDADMQFNQNDDYGKCVWTGTISEYQNGSATGKSQVVRFELELRGSN